MSIFRGPFSPEGSNKSHSGLIIVGTPVVIEDLNAFPEQTPAPEPEPVTPAVNIHLVPHHDERIGLVKMDYESNTVDAYFDEYTIDIEFLEGNYRSIIFPAKVPQTSCEHLFSCKIDVDRIPTCKFFSPSVSQMENGSVPHPEYPYYNSPELAICLNPDRALIKSWDSTVYDTCAIADHQSCSVSSLNAWIELYVAYPEDGSTVKLEVNYLGSRVRYGRVVTIQGDNVSYHCISKISEEADQDELYAQFLTYTGDAEVVSTGNNLDSAFAVKDVPVNFLSSMLSTSTD